MPNWNRDFHKHWTITFFRSRANGYGSLICSFVWNNEFYRSLLHYVAKTVRDWCCVFMPHYAGGGIRFILQTTSFRNFLNLDIQCAINVILEKELSVVFCLCAQTGQVKHNFLFYCLLPVAGHWIETSRLSVAGGLAEGGYANNLDNPEPRYYQESQNRGDKQWTQDMVLAYPWCKRIG